METKKICPGCHTTVAPNAPGAFASVTGLGTVHGKRCEDRAIKLSKAGAAARTRLNANFRVVKLRFATLVAECRLDRSATGSLPKVLTASKDDFGQLTAEAFARIVSGGLEILGASTKDGDGALRSKIAAFAVYATSTLGSRVRAPRFEGGSTETVVNESRVRRFQARYANAASTKPTNGKAVVAKSAAKASAKPARRKNR